MNRFSPGHQAGLLIVAGAVLLAFAVGAVLNQGIGGRTPGPAADRLGAQSRPDPLPDRPLTQGQQFLLGRCLNLNLATAQELDLLPGIGPRRAQAIIRLRSERDGLGSLKDLKDLPGWGPHLAEKLRPLVCFSP